MYTSAIAQIICDTYETLQRNSRGLYLSFSVHIDYDKEDGYRWRDLAVFAPHGRRYVYVLMRERWNVRPTGSDEYEKGMSEWRKLSHHDSCGREDGVGEFVHFYAKEHSMLNSFFNQIDDFPDVCEHRWYASFEPTDEFVDTIKDIPYYNVRTKQSRL